ncbi:DHA2 family efflux MFS transporter permease subunit [Tumebacillus permanentifrigoris]|uniref:EmrB/QacA subfamily drug resistance transporter n=1 Tax=Tumebacillus permanentifrigoris TaxID=378543 RepID=A0A316DDP5_9BACL|nr:DHA2 family efflux MFS transporter permease subunit [Tumebacillus permanentifrigoris]PWK15816.1 EmrB/QacA subfamily drug resistance transporter [Tumebacillus permanentifrigoris]
MTAFLWGYGAFAVLLLLLVNGFLRRRASRMAQRTKLEPHAASPSGRPAATPASSGAPDLSNLKIGKLLAVVLLGGFVAVLNQSLLNIALPHMMNDLNVSATTINWLITGYMLMNGVTIPLSSFLTRRFGTRNLFIFAILLFTLGAIICAASPGFTLILVGRFVQAGGAGLIMPLMMNVVLTVFPPEKRGMAMGLAGVVVIFAPAIGPTLAGWVVQNYSWRLLFILVIPIGIIDLLIALTWMKDVTERVREKFDLWGFLFSTIGFGDLLFGFSKAGSAGWTSPQVLIPIVVGIIGLALFVWRELTTDEPMLDLRAFGYSVFTLAIIVSSLMYMAMIAAMVLLPIYLQNIRGFTPVESGLLLLPGALMMAVFSPIAGGLMNRIGARPLIVTGLVISVITTWQFTHLSADTSYGTILVLNSIRMIGMALMMMTTTTEGLNQLPERLGSHGTALSNTFQQVFASLGTALLVTIMTTHATYHAASLANEMTTTNPLLYQQLGRLGQGVAVSTGLSAQASNSLVSVLMNGLIVKESTIQGINDAFVVGTALTAAALLTSLFMRRSKAKVVSQPAEGYHEA